MKNRVEVWRKMVVNIKLVKLTVEYKKQLTDMMMSGWQSKRTSLHMQFERMITMILSTIWKI